MNKSLLAIAALAAFHGSSQAQDLGGWETAREALPLTGPCAEPLDPFAIMMVEPRLLPWALDALSQSEVIPLTEARAQELTGGPRPSAADPEGHPFLVRSVMGSQTGWFQVRVCGAGLFVGHGSMSQEPPTPSRVPLVLWLRQKPARVYATWSFAQ
jgi:hypothetical protein